ncbi:MAG: hypothetical protein Q4F88_06930 [Eubacteriales bacterium]|nr:hypothetical protein [Eubacteriales bacterium]
MDNQILEAINEMEEQNFKSINEALDIYDYEEIINFYLEYHGYGHSTEMFNLFRTFYILVEKPCTEF